MVDILILGATGYTGKLVTRYLQVHREREAFTLGIAGRSKTKLADLVADLDLGNSVRVFQVDVADDDVLQDVVSQTKVVLNTVGPYYVWGNPVVKACARLGVHYVDITGETPFVREIIYQYDYLATKTHAIIVPSCGLDSLPSDALAFLGARTLLARTGARAGVAQSHTMYTLRVGMSGGTLATALAHVERVPRRAIRAARRPYALSPVAGTRAAGPAPLVYRMPAGARRCGHASPLGPHNVAVVERTWGLLQLAARGRRGGGGGGGGGGASGVLEGENGVGEGEGEGRGLLAYGDAFVYSESVAARNAFSAFFFGLAFALGQACLMMFPPARWLLRKLAPAPGQGPSDEQLEKGFIKGRNISVSTPLPDSDKSVVVETTVRGRGDPGYTLTAIMVSECALCLLAPTKLSVLAQEGGVLTPMSACGDVLIRRLAASGRFEFESEVIEDA